jgi:hypothetical protein
MSGYSFGSIPEIVVGPSTDTYVANKIQKLFNCDYTDFVKDYFPGGAPRLRIDMAPPLSQYGKFKDKHVLAAYRGKSKWNENEFALHMDTLGRVLSNLTEDTLFDAGRVDVGHLFYLNSRSDKNASTDSSEKTRRDDEGQGMEYKNDLKKFEGAGVHTILTFHPHFYRKPGILECRWKHKGKNWSKDKNDSEERSIYVACLDAVPSMIDYSNKEFGFDKGRWVIVTPGYKGGRSDDYEISHEFAKITDYKVIDINLKRKNEREKTYSGGQIDAEGCNVMIPDDIWASCNTIKTVIDNLKNYKGVYTVAANGVLPEKGYALLNELLDSDTYPLLGAATTETIRAGRFAKIPIHEEIKKFYEGHEKYQILQIADLSLDKPFEHLKAA